MIMREYGEHFGICDICDRETPLFDTWGECRDYIRENWTTKKNEETGEWEHHCPDCARKLRRTNILQDFDTL